MTRSGRVARSVTIICSKRVCAEREMNESDARRGRDVLASRTRRRRSQVVLVELRVESRTHRATRVQLLRFPVEHTRATHSTRLFYCHIIDESPLSRRKWPCLSRQNAILAPICLDQNCSLESPGNSFRVRNWLFVVSSKTRGSFYRVKPGTDQFCTFLCSVPKYQLAKSYCVLRVTWIKFQEKSSHSITVSFISAQFRTSRHDQRQTRGAQASKLICCFGNQLQAVASVLPSPI